MHFPRSESEVVTHFAVVFEAIGMLQGVALIKA